MRLPVFRGARRFHRAGSFAAATRSSGFVVNGPVCTGERRGSHIGEEIVEMDGEQFDDVARRLGDRPSRRSVLGVLAGATGIGLGLGLGLGDTSGKRHKRRRRRTHRGRVDAQITDGALDGNGHPYVGLMSAQTKSGQHLWRCSGTLLSPTIFLTAGHCTEPPAERVQIWFAADVDAGIANGSISYPAKGDASGTPYTHPQYDPNAFYRYDLGVVVLDKPFKRKKYGALPQRDVLDTLATQRGQQDLGFTAVGYGLQKAFPDAAAWKEQARKVRMVAYPHLVQINTGYTGDFSVLLSNNANTGGTCFGDSGGPNFIGTSNVIGGVTSYGNNDTCAGTGGVYRVDRADDLDWLYGTFGSRLR
jgi:V8-like Glu-specific endopeptidase